MTETTPVMPKSNYLYAALAAATGIYFFLMGARLLPVPGGPSNLHGPHWLVLCVGVAFFLAGIAIAIETVGLANAATGALPAGAPRWLSVVQYLIGLTIFICFGLIASWVAFGPGERHFSGTLLFADEATNTAIGRTVFGVGALIIWLATAAVLAFGIRKFFDDERPNAG